MDTLYNSLGRGQAGAQGLFAGAATANLELPFMLSTWGQESGAGEDPKAAVEFSEMLMDLMQEEEQADQAGIPNTLPPANLIPGFPNPAPGLASYYPAAPSQQPAPYSQQTITSQPPIAAPPASAPSPLTSTSHVLSHRKSNGQSVSDGNTSGGGSAGGVDGASSKSGNRAARRAAVQKRYRQKKESALHILQQEANRQMATLQMLEEQKTALLTKQSTLEKLVSCRDEQLAVLSRARGLCRQPASIPFITDSGRVVEDPQGGCCFGEGDCAEPVQPGPDELAQYKQMSVEDVIGKWKQFVGSASQLLTQQAMAPPGVATTAGRELYQLVSDVGAMMKRIIQLNCAALYMVMQVNLETGFPSTAPDSHWQGVLPGINFTPQQKMEAIAMFELYVQLMEKVLEERRMLKAGLAQMALEKAHGSDSGAQLPDYLLPPGACCMEEMQFAEQLLLSLHKERSTRCLLCCFFFGKLLTPYQLAQAAVSSHPHFPEPLALCRAITMADRAAKAKVQG